MFGFSLFLFDTSKYAIYLEMQPVPKMTP